MRPRGALFAVALVAGIALILALWWLSSRTRDATQALSPDVPAAESALELSLTKKTASEPASVERAFAAVGVAPSTDTSSPDSSALGRVEWEVSVVRATSLQPLAGASVFVLDEPNATDQGERFERELDRGRVEELLATCAAPLIADEQGRVRVSIADHGSMLVGVAPGAFGTLLLRANSPPPRRLELRTDFDLRAKVVDSQSRPVEAVSVSVRQSWGGWFDDVFAVETDADGLAELRHVGSQIGRNLDLEFQCSLAVAEGLDPPVEVRFDLRAPPIEPVLLTLPPTASCTVYIVDAAGHPYLRPVEVDLRLAHANGLGELSPTEFVDQTTALARREFVDTGSVKFGHVTPGRDLIVTVRRRGVYVGQTVRAAGPTLAGQHVDLTISLGAELVTFAGRVLDESDAVLSGVRLRARLETVNRERGVWLGIARSDEAGRFEFDVEPERVQREPFSFVVSKFTDNLEEPLAARRELPALLAPGTHELGDFVLRKPPILAAGRVLDAAGQPAPGALVALQWQRHSEPEVEDIGLIRLRTYCDASGRFTLRGDGKPLAIGLVATLDQATSEVREVTPGDGDVTLILGASGALAGTLLLDPSVSHRSLSILARYDDPSAVGSDMEGFESSVPLEESGEFVLRGLRPGVYAVVVRRSDTWEDLVVVEDLLVRADELTRDPRVNPLDLREMFRALHLNVVDEVQAPIQEGWVFVYASADAQPTWSWLDHGRVTLVTDGHPVNVTIVADGFLTHRMSNVVMDQTVQLRRGPSVRLVLAAGLQAPEPPLFLSARFTALEEESEWFDDGMEFDARGVALGNATRLGPSRLILMLTKRDDQSYSSVDFDSVTERIVELRDVPGEQVIEVSFEPSAIEEHARYLDQ